MNRKSLSFFFVFMLVVQICAAQQYLDDLVNNKTEEFYKKITLLGKNIKDEPYLAYYLANTEVLRSDVVDFLIKKGADLNRYSDTLLPPLLYAIERQDNRVLKLLIDAKANVNVVVEYEGKSMQVLIDEYYINVEYVKAIKAKRLSPLAYAFYWKNALAFELLLKAGADPFAVLLQEKDSKAQKNVNYTLIDTIFSYLESKKESTDISHGRFRCFAALWNYLQTLPKEKRVFPSYNNIFMSIIKNDIKAFKGFASALGETKWLAPLSLYARAWDVLDFVLAYNSATIDTPIIEYDYGKYYSLLEWTVLHSMPDYVIDLLQRGAKVPSTITVQSDTSKRETSTLSLIARFGNLDLLKLVLEKTPKDEHAYALLGCHAYPDIRQYLITSGVSPANLFKTKKDSFGTIYQYSVLTDAAREGAQEAVMFYLKIGIPVVPTQPDEIPPLFAAIYSGHLEIVKTIIDAGSGFTVQAAGNMRETYFDTMVFYGKYTPLAFAYYVKDRVYDSSLKQQYTAIIQYLEGLGAKR